ncbi:hypothetical protein DUI87_08475 [Hirundo rustica rustica]|uniref:Uncharacterized protein n=1 Tax=Hirundo rustica rustica TaxID=333673 RepID=A0A3M0KZW2_HIRRU|nr:hypothetical protein DUI87_08475 [Hirundo rustica rustica]
MERWAERMGKSPGSTRKCIILGTKDKFRLAFPGKKGMIVGNINTDKLQAAVTALEMQQQQPEPAFRAST